MSDGTAPASPSPGPSAPAREGGGAARSGRARAVGVIAVIAALLSAVAIGVATLLDEPVGQSSADASQPIVAGPVVAPGEELTGGGDPLPPASVVLATPLPAAIARLPEDQQLARLRTRAEGSADAAAWVEYGAALQRSGEQSPAADAFRRALTLDPDDLEARVGLLVALGAPRGEAGLTEAAKGIAALVRRNPRNQMLAFNQGWIAVYLRDARGAVAAWQRAATLGPRTALGQTATALLRTVQQAGSPGGP